MGENLEIKEFQIVYVGAPNQYMGNIAYTVIIFNEHFAVLKDFGTSGIEGVSYSIAPAIKVERRHLCATKEEALAIGGK